MINLKHLSYSSINTYHLCPSAWKRHYIDKVQTPTATALVFGSAFHATVEAYIRMKNLEQGIMEIGDNQTRERLKGLDDADSLLAWWGLQWAAKLEKEPNIDWGDETPEALADLGAKMLGKLDVSGSGANRKEMAGEFLSKIVPMMNNGKPVIERKVSLSVPGVPIPVIGYIDIITADGVPSDFKTASRAWYKSKADEELQPTFYLAALAQMGEPVPDGKFRYYIFTKAKSPKAQILETSRTAGEMLWLFELIRQTWQAIEAGVFPSNPTTWKCNPKYCDYWNMCRGAF